MAATKDNARFGELDGLEIL